MKSSIFIAATSAVLAMAGPVQKREYVTEIQTYYDTVTVTAGAETSLPTPSSGSKQQAPAPEDSKPQEVAPPAPSVVVVTATAQPQQPTPTPQPTTQPKPTTQGPTVVVVTVSPDPQPTQATPTSQQPQGLVIPSSIAAPLPTAPSDDDFKGSALYHHNLHRANHSAPEVSWDDKLADYASKTAKKCVFAHDMDEGDGGYGQNIAMWAVSSGAEKLGEAGAIKMATTDMWYNGEFNNYHSDYYGKSSPDMSNFDSWGHYTQLIWKSSNTLGCEVEYCPAGTMVDGMDAWYMVCNYGPAGNIFGKYGENVLAPLGEATVMGS